MYNAQIGRWNQVDPLSDSMLNWSPYNYTYNSPFYIPIRMDVPR
ncbi:hypothetical protein [Gynurincola endophyticus]